MRRVFKSIFICALALALCSSCWRDKDDENQKPQGPSTESHSSWYAVGMCYNEVVDTIAATVWKDGQVLYSIAEPEAYTIAYGISVSGKDVYYCGLLENSQSVYSVVWKNDKQILSVDIDSQVLSGHIVNGFTDVAVIGTDVYALGEVHLSTEGSAAVIFKNGTPAFVDRVSNGAEVTSIKAIGKSLYAVGCVEVNQQTKPAVWIDGSLKVVDVPTGADGGAIYSVSECNGDIYLAGELYIDSSDSTCACVWKNGVPENIATTAQGETYATGVAVLSDDIYASGQMWTEDDEFACVWKNDMQSMLGVGEAMGIVNCNGKIVVGGYSYYMDDDSFAPMATVWIDNEPHYLGYGMVARMQ